MTQPRVVPLQNLIVFGDSLSDIGIMNDTYLGMVAKTTGAMTTNETGRYSDGRNWTDYMYEWVGSDKLVALDAATTKKNSKKYQTLTDQSLIPLSNSVKDGPLVCYANLAKGGAVAASDVLAKGGALSYLSAQCDQYLDQRKKLGAKFTGDTLHIVWIGLNDIVTCNRADTDAGMERVYDKAPADVATLEPLYKKVPADEHTPLLAEHNPEYILGKALEGATKGEGVLPMVYDVVKLCNRIVAAFPDESHKQHFLFLSLPDPNIAPRIVALKAAGKLALVKQYVDLTVRFNKLLRSVATAGWQETENGVLPQNMTFVPMYERLRYVATHPTDFGLRSKAQLDKLTVKYGGSGEDTQEMAEARNFFTTTDAAHPTEAVYRLIALEIADTMVAKGYALGRLNPTRWAEDRQYV
ncbi:SGNH/GDSL hydrolase family protein [Nocardia mexicana]|uniref:Phospholipase/lecithinase/hemolysin n=1 Tax=Nocardia mexicana TaxID=279262 RepID=A0A370H1E7_9NOCA|nr:SGNH/GDSL hydrolase family protein [Nocardia mexicana]RDI49783.1 hypothetical protein DFR68_106220 [Nocardia mexicana]